MINDPTLNEFLAFHDKLTEILKLTPDISDRSEPPFNARTTD
jgi:hypothetical protein